MNRPQQNLVGTPGIAAPANTPSAEPGLISRSSTTSRRSFLGRGVAAAAVPAAIVAGSNLVGAAGTNPPFPSYYPGSTESKFQEIQLDEFDHVNIISGLIKSLGGTPRPLPTFKGIQGLTAAQFLALSKTFENTGVGAYLGALPYISSSEVTIAAAEIALVEAYHAGFVNTLANAPLVPNASPLATSIFLGNVLNDVAPFIANLNDNGAFPPVFQAIPSATNDIAILNFALLLEMLEAEFYFYNVPALYPK
jgi:Ferritin-like domain